MIKTYCELVEYLAYLITLRSGLHALPEPRAHTGQRSRGPGKSDRKWLSLLAYLDCSFGSLLRTTWF